jgi:hypothetical protein
MCLRLRPVFPAAPRCDLLYFSDRTLGVRQPEDRETMWCEPPQRYSICRCIDSSLEHGSMTKQGQIGRIQLAGSRGRGSGYHHLSTYT